MLNGVDCRPFGHYLFANRADLQGQALVKTVDDRSLMAKSLSKVSEIIAICLMMIVPGLIGYVVDQKFGTKIVFTLLGLIFGMTGAVFQLMRLVASTEESNTTTDDPDQTE